MLLEFTLTSLIVIVTPGTGALYTVAMGLAHGRSTAVVAAFGCTLGIVPHMAAAMAGLAAVLATNDAAFNILKLVGALYLIWMAINVWRDTRLLAPPSEAKRRTAGSIIRHAVLINLLNPKLSVFFLALLPQFVRPDDPGALAAMAGYGLAFMVMTFAVFALYGIFAALTRDRVLSSTRFTSLIRKAFAAAFLLLGIKLALAGR
ncbi:MAG: LysE family translocator [Rhizobium sp.]|nr:LysE family translocator [Rhizobium sp.]